MKIEGFGQINAIDTTKVTKAQNEANDFESALQKAFDEGDKKKLREACNEFEGVMLKTLYKQMKATVPESDLLEKSSARSMFEDMLDEELMDVSSKRGMGISEMMYKQLSAKMDNTYKVESKDESTTPVESGSAMNQENSGPDSLENQGTDGAEPIEE